MAGNRQPYFCWGRGHPSEMRTSFLTLMIRKHVRSVLLHRGYRKFCPHSPAGWEQPALQGWVRWTDPLCKHPVSPDMLLRQPSQSFQKHSQENKENYQRVGFLSFLSLDSAALCLWCTVLGTRERHVPWVGFNKSALCFTWASLSCFPAYELVALSNHLLRTVRTSVLLSFASFPPFRPTMPARGPEPGLFTWLKYIQVPISPTSYWPRYNLPQLSSLHSQPFHTK